MTILEYNITTSSVLAGLLQYSTIPVTINFPTQFNRTNTNAYYYNDKSTPPPPKIYSNPMMATKTSHQNNISAISSTISSLMVTATSTDVPSGLLPSNSDSTTIAKITALLVITAIVLVISYRFVVRLFLGYADRKDDVLSDGFSDEEDSAVVKIKIPESYNIEI